MYRMRRNKNGFALIVTITLMAFLVVLLLSFTTLTQVQTQAAGNAQQLLQARQNALLGLSVALGQLQRFAGPDQRTTATADINESGQSGTHAWTGVWGNARMADDYVSAPRLLGWLVSGNESATFSASTDAENFGQISAASTPVFSPSDNVDLGSAGSIGALATDASIQSKDARLLVGPGTVADSADYVVAPLVDVPAADSAANAGGYAWWVGDEGVKARLNLVDPRVATATTAQERFYRLLLAQRHGIELMTSDGTSTFGSTLYNVENMDEAGAKFRSELAQTLQYDQAPLLTGFNNDAMRSALSRRSPDLTVWSRGVLADQLRGGLRHDLTALFETPASAWTGALRTSLDAVSAFAPDGTRHIADFQSDRLYRDYSTSPQISADDRSPLAATWEQLRSFYNYAQTNTGRVNATRRTDTQMALAPIVQRWGMNFDISADALGGNGQLHFFPQVVLWNPYNTTLRGSYRVRFQFGTNNNNTTLKYLYFATPRLDTAGDPIFDFPYDVYHVERLVPTSGTHAIPANVSSGKYFNRHLEFTIPEVDIPPGQAYVFTVDPTQAGAYSNSNDNWLANTYNTTASFTRSLANTFTPSQLDYTTLAIANTGTGDGGTSAFYLLDADGNPLQIIDGVGFSRRATVDRNDGTATSLVGEANGGKLDDFYNIATAPVHSRKHMGIAAVNAHQQTNGRYNWLAHYNQRAASVGQAWFERNGKGFAPFNWGTITPWAASGNSSWDLDIVPGSTNRTYTGPGRTPATGVGQTILFHLPRANAPLLTLGQLQHAALTYTHNAPGESSYNFPFPIDSGQEPTYPFGNSYADPRIPQHLLLRPSTESWTPNSSGAGTEGHLTDVSYLLNRALWDRFFFSGRPTVSATQLQAQIDAGDPLPDARLRWLGGTTAANAADFDRAASNLLVDGAFNVNSTSVEAWAALLGSLRGVRVDPANGAAGAMSETPYVRTPYASAGSGNSRADQWAGYRTLSDAQIRELAVAIVAEVQARGPFLSMADFVNRRLVDFGDDTGLSGALQAAIDSVTDINSTVLDADLSVNNPIPTGSNEVWTLGGGAEYYLQNLKAPRRAASDETQSKAAMAPGFLSQADLLSALGNGLCARSDTFVIRAYGETVNPQLPATDADYVTARAWCEAVVQRLPEYVDAAGNAAHVQPVTDNSVNLTPQNQSFGRRFEVVSFRWLNPDDI